MRFHSRAAALLATLLLAAAHLASAQSSLRLRFLDVGQGDAILITNGGRTVLVDTGPTDDIAPHLRRLGVDTVDLLIIPHPHLDHLGGADAVLERFPVRNYMDNGVPYTTAAYRKVLRLVRARKVRYLRADTRRIEVGDATLDILPIPAATRDDPNPNNQSIGVVLRRGTFTALLTGDSQVEEINGWLDAGLLPADVKVEKAAHHGSRNGMTPALLARTRPEVVVVSVGAGNSYGHPSPWAMRYYRTSGRRVLRTDEVGDVLIQVESNGAYSVHVQRSAIP